MLAEQDAPSLAGNLPSLGAVEWDFASAKTSFLTHGLHPYPAKYIPQIPDAIIRELSLPGEIVADIFCGSGTTLVEALRLGRNAVGVDANPLACLISRAKTTPLAPGDEQPLRALQLKARSLAASLADKTTLPLLSGGPFVSSAWRPMDESLAFWFAPFIIEELAEILSWCRLLPTEASRTVALTAFSSIVVAVSRQDSDTRYVRREKNLRPGDACQKFAAALGGATDAVVAFTREVSAGSSSRLIEADVLSGPDIGLVDLVVCSPPYPNAYSYHLYHRTRMDWLGMDQPRFKREEIGSHRKYSSKGVKGATVATFHGEMVTIFGWLVDHLRPGRYACFVVGDSTIRGETIHNADVLADAAATQGFREVRRIVRRMRDAKKSFNPAIGKIKHEYLLVLERGGGSH